MGKVVILPKGYKGIVAQETMKPMKEGAERNIHVMHTFTSFMYWNWDKPPSLNDALLSALDWIDVSEAVIIYCTFESFKYAVIMSVRYVVMLLLIFQLHSVTDDNSG
jgi:Ribonuclease H2 non-catalytic subunit (Ylr154p-like).